MIKRWTDKELAWVTKHVKGVQSDKLTAMFNKRFDQNVTVNQMRSFKKNHNLTSGVVTRFVKGRVSHNKGVPVTKEVYKHMQKTMFKKGNIPHNIQPVGTQRISGDGYVEVKVADPNKWRQVHRMIWEEAYGPIPENHVVIFRDRDKQNLKLENLKLVSRSTLLVANNRNLISNNANITDSGIILAELVNTLREAKKVHRKKRK